MQALLSRYQWSREELRGLLPGLAEEVLRHDPDDLTEPGLAFDETPERVSPPRASPRSTPG